MVDLDELRDKIHADNRAVGWWDHTDAHTPFVKTQMIITEIAEATEGARKGLMDTHLPHHKMEDVELADAMIRTLDFGGWLRLSYDAGASLSRTVCVLKSSDHPAVMHLALCSSVVNLVDSRTGNLSIAYSTLLNDIMKVSLLRGFDLFAIIEEKLEYNRQRADHKRENRSKDGGKKF